MNKIKIVIDRNVHSISQEYTYLANDIDFKKLKIGSCVVVDFNHSEVIGFVTELNVDSNKNYTKEIKRIVEANLLTEYQINLYKLLKDQYICSNLDLFNLFLNKKIKNMLKQYINIDEMLIKKQLAYTLNDDKAKLTPKQKLVVENIQDGVVTNSALCELVSPSVITTMLKKGILIKSYVDYTYQVPFNFEKKVNTELTHVQKEVYNKILESEKPVLLHGVTGSGKTEIYLKIIEEYLSNEKQILFLVPEITLVVNFAARLKNIYGDEIAYIHSKLTEEQLFNYYMKIKSNKIKVIIGTRSSIFMPFYDLGLVIVDEEHDSSYKSNNKVTYDIKEIVLQLNTKLVLASATPDIKTMAMAKKGILTLIELKERYNGYSLPKVVIQPIKNHDVIFSTDTLLQIKNELSKGKKVIILYNQKGYAKNLECQTCYDVVKCPNCNIGIPYYKNKDKVVCNYCGFQSKIKVCSICRTSNYKELGIGIEKVQEYLKKLFDEEILLLDGQLASKKKYVHEIMEKLVKDEPLVLLGTQIIAKGLNVENCDLVVIPNVDNAIFYSDYKAQERLFQLLTQTIGRSGRQTNNGKVIIQTMYPKYELFDCVVKNDYAKFYKQEMNLRKLNRAMPFYNIAQIMVSHEHYQVCENFLNRLSNELKKLDTIVGNITTPYIEYKYKKVKRLITVRYRREDIKPILLLYFKKSQKEQIEMLVDLNIDQELS